jgi:hypothetical protein
MKKLLALFALAFAFVGTVALASDYEYSTLLSSPRILGRSPTGLPAITQRLRTSRKRKPLAS